VIEWWVPDPYSSAPSLRGWGDGGFLANDYKLQETVTDKLYASLLPALSENGLAADKGLTNMIETLGTAVGKNVDIPPERLVDYTLLREAQKELGIQ